MKTKKSYYRKLSDEEFLKYINCLNEDHCVDHIFCGNGCCSTGWERPCHYCRKRFYYYKMHYICFSCNITYKSQYSDMLVPNCEDSMTEKRHTGKPEYMGSRCPTCSKDSVYVSYDFRAPKKNDKREWKKLKNLYDEWLKCDKNNKNKNNNNNNNSLANKLFKYSTRYKCDSVTIGESIYDIKTKKDKKRENNYQLKREKLWKVYSYDVFLTKKHLYHYYEDLVEEHFITFKEKSDSRWSYDKWIKNRIEYK